MGLTINILNAGFTSVFGTKSQHYLQILSKTRRICHVSGAGWSSTVARRAHNPKVVGSNPAPQPLSHKVIFKYTVKTQSLRSWI